MINPRIYDPVNKLLPPVQKNLVQKVGTEATRTFVRV